MVFLNNFASVAVTARYSSDGSLQSDIDPSLSLLSAAPAPSLPVYPPASHDTICFLLLRFWDTTFFTFYLSHARSFCQLTRENPPPVFLLTPPCVSDTPSPSISFDLSSPVSPLHLSLTLLLSPLPHLSPSPLVSPPLHLSSSPLLSPPPHLSPSPHLSPLPSPPAPSFLLFCLNQRMA